MDRHSSSSPDNDNNKKNSKTNSSPKSPKSSPKKESVYCSASKSSSHTQYFRVPRHSDKFTRITKDQYLNVSESISSTGSFDCYHKGGKKYTPEGYLKRNFKKELDPVPIDLTWTEGCPLTWGWDLAEKIEFLVCDSSVLQQLDRLEDHLRDLTKLSCKGFRVDIMRQLSLIINFLLDKMKQYPILRKHVEALLINMKKPILLSVVSDTVKYFGNIKHFMGFLVYLLISLEDDRLFDLVSEAVLWHITTPDSDRGVDAVKRSNTLAAAKSLSNPIAGMLASTSSYRFYTFLETALVLACDLEENCIEMMKQNVIENIFYRFNPYFPNKHLPWYDMGPADSQDINIKLGDSSVHMRTTLSLLLVLTKTTKDFLDKNPQYRTILPCPDGYSTLCFIWAYRYECVKRNHCHERITLTIIAAGLLKCFGKRLMGFASTFMPDVMSLAVLTELPKRDDWIGKVNFNTLQLDVQFKKVLIYLVVDMLKVFPFNKFMVSARYWLLGLMYLLDPGLTRLKAHWSASHYDELRKIALQALVCTIPLCEPQLIREYSLIRRIMWFIEWYTESPYSIIDLYWCVRLLYVTVCCKDAAVGIKYQSSSIQDLYDTHGIIILTNLCFTLLRQKTPPVEKSQAVMAVCLRMLGTALRIDDQRQVFCCVYPSFKWPQIIYPLTKRMITVVLYSLEKHYLISDRWLIALLNFTKEAVIWNDKYRELFIDNNGVYKLLDIITMTGPSVQCLALGLICDVVRAGNAVGQLVTWRAGSRATHTNPILVKRGSTIATLLAAIFRDECQGLVNLSEFGVLQDVDTLPVMTKRSSSFTSRNSSLKSNKSNPSLMCESAFDLSGSRRSKVFAILHMLSKDLQLKVEIADETYNMYKNIQLDVKDETILVLCSHFLTVKLNDTWAEVKEEVNKLVLEDELILNDFLEIGKGWNREIKLQQEDVIKRNQKKEHDEENSLYAFLGRIRLNIALDALKNVRCVARSADRYRITHALLHDAVFAHQRLALLSKKFDVPVLKTYKAPLDDANIIGQNIKVCSIYPKGATLTVDVSSTAPTPANQ